MNGCKISWKNNIDKTDFTVSYTVSLASKKKRQISEGTYFAFGLSNDTEMVN